MAIAASLLPYFLALHLININQKIADQLLQNLQKNEAILLHQLCLVAETPQEKREFIEYFSAHLKRGYAKKILSLKSENYIHDSRLITYPMGSSNALETIKNLLLQFEIEPTSIDIVIGKIPEAIAAVELVDTIEEGCCNRLLQDVTVIPRHRLIIDYSMLEYDSDSFCHIINHEIGHLLEGHSVIGSILHKVGIPQQEYLGIYHYYRFNTEKVAEVKTAFISPTSTEYALRGLCFHAFLEAMSNFLPKIIVPVPPVTHPTKMTRYKLHQEINNLLWKIPVKRYVPYFFVTMINRYFLNLKKLFKITKSNLNRFIHKIGKNFSIAIGTSNG